MMTNPRPWMLACACAAALAPAARAESLADAVAYAYETNPGVAAQRAALRALDESYVQARAQFGLQITASAGLTSEETRRSFQGKADAETTNVGLTVQQPVWSGGRLSTRLSEAEAQIRAGREQLRRAELDLLVRVVGAYMSVRRDEQLVKLGTDSVTAYERSLADTEAKFRVRNVTATDLQISRARLAQARTQLFNLQEQLTASRAQYFAAVGQNPGTLEPPPPLEGLPEDIEKALTAAEGNSPQLLAAAFTEQSSRARIARAKASYAPNVAARFDMQRNPTQRFSNLVYDNNRTASIVLSVPIFTAGQIASGVRQATQENNRDRLSIDEARLQVLANTTQTWERLQSLRRQLTTLEDEARADEIAFFGVRAEERLGLRSNIEVLNAQAELNAAQLNLARARAAEFVARVQVLAVIGVLTPKTLSPNAQVYDPVANFRKVKDKGALPLELPVRALDMIARPPIGGPRPASIAEAAPTGSPAEPTPGPERPLPSILDVYNRQLSDQPVTTAPKE